jgi:hypothetical protein
MATYADALDSVISWLTTTRRRWNLHLCLNRRSKQTNNNKKRKKPAFIVTDRVFRHHLFGFCVSVRENCSKKGRGSDLNCTVRGSNGDAMQPRIFYNT